jgi:sarcosine oxidase
VTAADVIVVGAGVAGLATARELARRGRAVTVLERDVAGNELGSSRGDARMRVPAAYPTDDYLLRGLLAGEDWRALEAETGEELLVETGCLSWGEDQDRLAAALAAHDVEHALLDAAEVAHAHPGLAMPAGAVAVFQPDAQTILADRALTAFARSGRAAGAELRERVAVERIEPARDHVLLRTSAGELECGHAIVAAGPWAPGLLEPLGIELALRTTVQTVGYFDVGADAPRVGLVRYGEPDPYSLWAPSGRKAANHRAGPAAPPEAPRTPAEDELASVAGWLGERFGAARRMRHETCLYTTAPQEEFAIERHGRVLVVSACSGQGFQLAPDTARRAADVIDQ